MTIQEMLESKRAKTEEFETIMALAKTEERKLSEDESAKVEGLKAEVTELDSQISDLERQEAEEKEAAEKAEAERKEAEAEAERQAAEKAELEKQEAEAKLEAERQEAEKLEAEKLEAERKANETKEALYAEVKAEVEVAFRAMSVEEAEDKLDLAEYELDLAYIALDKAWNDWYKANEAAEEDAIKDEIKKLIVDVLSETQLRAEAKVNADKELSEREAKIKELEETLNQEREAKKALESKENNKNNKDLSVGERKNIMNKEIYEGLRSGVSTANKMTKIVVESDSEGRAIINGERAAIDGDTSVMQDVIPKGVNDISIIGYEPMYKEMGVEVYEDVKGTYVLPWEDPIHAEDLDELSSATGDTVVPDGILIKPRRYQKWKDFTLETLESATNNFFDKTIENLVKGVDRQITKQVYAKALAGATEVAGAGLDKDGFDALMAEAEIEYEGAFLANRKTFFEAKGVVIDAGSGRFLAEKAASDRLGKGSVYDGTPFWYSNLFEDGASQKYVVYGDTGMIHVADYGKTEIIIDNMTQINEGKIRITVVKLADVALKNPVAFSKTPDLDLT